MADVGLLYLTILIDALIATRWILIAFFAFATTRWARLLTRDVRLSCFSIRSAHGSNSRLRCSFSYGLSPEWNIRPIGV